MKRIVAMLALVVMVFAACPALAEAPVLPRDVDEALHEARDARIREILNNDAEIVHSDTFIPGETYTGTAYYVANDGDDENDGLTPETPWRTLFKVCREVYWGEDRVCRPGDAIFFKRGDVFSLSEGGLECEVENVTFSAYGNGPKPIITGSTESGSGPEKWILESGTDGAKIWRYHMDMNDVSMIVLEGDASNARRVYEYWDGEGYQSCEAVGWWMHESKAIELTGVHSLEETLSEDMTFVSRPMRTEGDNHYMGQEPGPLYLRCDAGNPGELYDSIEFSEYYHAAANIGISAPGTVIDNISLRCNACAFIRPCQNWREIRDVVVQNCEFAYGGGGVTFYFSEEEDGMDCVAVQGDGVYTIITDATIRNNYFHDCTCTTTTYEWSHEEHEPLHGYYHVLDNVMVNTMGIRLDSTSDVLYQLDSVVVRGNQVWNTGAMDVGKYYYSEGSVVLTLNQYGECLIEDNLFYCTENGITIPPTNALLDIYEYDYADTENTRPTLANNVYVQHRGRNWGDFHLRGAWAIEDPELEAKAAQWLGDETSQFYILEE